MGLGAGYLSTMIAVLYFLTIYGLHILGKSTILRPGFRMILADYAYVVSNISGRLNNELLIISSSRLSSGLGLHISPGI